MAEKSKSAAAANPRNLRYALLILIVLCFGAFVIMVWLYPGAHALFVSIVLALIPFLCAVAAFTTRNRRARWLLVVFGGLVVGVGTWYSNSKLIQEKEDLANKINAHVGFLQQYMNLLPPDQKPKVMLAFAKVIREEFKQRQYDRIYQVTELLLRAFHDNGLLAYYQGEIWRIRENIPEMRKAFFRYLAMESNQPEEERSGDAEVCYNFRPEGFCGERTAWVCHLMASELYEQAVHVSGLKKKPYLEEAEKYMECENRWFPSGFIVNDPPKVFPTEVLRGNVEQALKELGVTNQNK
jgi:hypothetical protein